VSDAPAIERLLAELTPKGVASACLDPRSFQGTLFPEEAAAVANAVPRRRAEFIAGRGCARQALVQLGQPAHTIPSGQDRAPIWPEGIVGSISHCDSLAIAVVARRADGFLSLGVDIEAASPLEAELIESICTPAERQNLASAGDAGLLAKTIFSIKESAYKAQYPLTRTMLEFHEVEVKLDLAAMRFSAVVAGCPQSLTGQFRIEAGYILTLTCITSEAAGPARVDRP